VTDFVVYRFGLLEIFGRRDGFSHTLLLLALGPLMGVPSRFSGALPFADAGTDSSRVTGFVKSAYFLQLVPQSSHRTLLDSPFGAFHHCTDSLVLHDAQTTLLRGCFTMEPSGSSSTTGGDGVFVFLLEARSFLIWMLTSLSFELVDQRLASGF